MATSKILYNNPFVAKRYLTANDDLDDFKGKQYNGLYYISTAATAPANTPLALNSTDKASYGLLFCFSGHATTAYGTSCQIYINNQGGNIGIIPYIRYYAGSPANWSNWHYIVTSGNIEQTIQPQNYSSSVLVLNKNIIDYNDGTDWGSALIKKIGRIVILNCQVKIKANLTSSQGETIATFTDSASSILKPLHLSRNLWTNASSSIVRYGGVTTVESNGGIYMHSPIFTTNPYMFLMNCTYITAS